MGQCASTTTKRFIVCSMLFDSSASNFIGRATIKLERGSSFLPQFSHSIRTTKEKPDVERMGESAEARCHIQFCPKCGCRVCSFSVWIGFNLIAVCDSISSSSNSSRGRSRKKSTYATHNSIERYQDDNSDPNRRFFSRDCGKPSWLRCVRSLSLALRHTHACKNTRWYIQFKFKVHWMWEMSTCNRIYCVNLIVIGLLQCE